MSDTPVSGGYGCVDITGTGWTWAVGEAIRKFTRSQFDHCFVVLDAKGGYILEAQPGASRISNISEYSGCEMVFSSDAVLGGDVAKLTTAAQAFTGIPYNFLDIAYLGLLLGPGWRPNWLFRAVVDSPDMICSQLVAQFGVKYGAKSWQCGQADPQLVTPGMLATRAINES